MLHDLRRSLLHLFILNQFNTSLIILNALNWFSEFREDWFFYLRMKNNISSFDSREISSNLWILHKTRVFCPESKVYSMFIFSKSEF